MNEWDQKMYRSQKFEQNGKHRTITKNNSDVNTKREKMKYGKKWPIFCKNFNWESVMSTYSDTKFFVHRGHCYILSKLGCHNRSFSIVRTSNEILSKPLRKIKLIIAEAASLQCLPRVCVHHLLTVPRFVRDSFKST